MLCDLPCKKPLSGISSRRHLLNAGGGHALEALSVRLVDLWDLEVVLGELLLELGGVEHAVGASGLDDLGLLLEGEVLPLEVWTNVLLEEGEDLVVGDGTGVGEVVDAGVLVLSHEDGTWEEVVEDCVGVWNVNDTVVLGDLGDKVAGVKVVRDWHSQAEDEDIWVVLHDLISWLVFGSCRFSLGSTYLLNVSLGLRVEGAGEVGLVGLGETLATHLVLLIVLVDASGSEDGAVDVLQEAAVGQVKGTDNIVADGVLLVVLAPIDVWASSGAGAVEDVGWLNSLELSNDGLTVLHADSGGSDLLALGLEESLEVASNPSLSTPDEERIRHYEVCSVWWLWGE